MAARDHAQLRASTHQLRRGVARANDEEAGNAPIDDRSPDVALIARQDLERLRRAIAAPPHYRDVLVLVELAERKRSAKACRFSPTVLASPQSMSSVATPPVLPVAPSPPAWPSGNVARVITSERWFSPELHVVVFAKTADPRVGETSYRLANLRR